MMEEFLVVPVSGEMKVLQLDGDDPGFFATLREMIGADGVEIVHCGEYLMLVDDCGAILDPPKPINKLASTLYPGSDYGDYIHGDALIGALGFRNGEPDIVGLYPRQLTLLQGWFSAVGGWDN